eukprot:TRINITY_DN3152_c1_g1_i1.p1 TRINITY_DN3152_c1_g1~~TRINITY_DN3152_c1_g1_i1.p1  ORF type:complete len:917 (+),score=152.30 TRINITY_DN3152_c1_g1_i1:102-2852(+)
MTSLDSFSVWRRVENVTIVPLEAVEKEQLLAAYHAVNVLNEDDCEVLWQQAGAILGTYHSQYGAFQSEEDRRAVFAQLQYVEGDFLEPDEFLELAQLAKSLFYENRPHDLDTIDAFVSLGGNSDKSGTVDLRNLTAACEGMGIRLDVSMVLVARAQAAAKAAKQATIPPPPPTAAMPTTTATLQSPRPAPATTITTTTAAAAAPSSPSSPPNSPTNTGANPPQPPPLVMPDSVATILRHGKEDGGGGGGGGLDATPHFSFTEVEVAAPPILVTFPEFQQLFRRIRAHGTTDQGVGSGDASTEAAAGGDYYPLGSPSSNMGILNSPMMRKRPVIQRDSHWGVVQERLLMSKCCRRLMEAIPGIDKQTLFTIIPKAFDRSLPETLPQQLEPRRVLANLQLRLSRCIAPAFVSPPSQFSQSLLSSSQQQSHAPAHSSQQPPQPLADLSLSLSASRSRSTDRLVGLSLGASVSVSSPMSHSPTAADAKTRPRSVERQTNRVLFATPEAQAQIPPALAESPAATQVQRPTTVAAAPPTICLLDELLEELVGEQGKLRTSTNAPTTDDPLQPEPQQGDEAKVPRRRRLRAAAKPEAPVFATEVRAAERRARELERQSDNTSALLPLPSPSSPSSPAATAAPKPTARGLTLLERHRSSVSSAHHHHHHHHIQQQHDHQHHSNTDTWSLRRTTTGNTTSTHITGTTSSPPPPVRAALASVARAKPRRRRFAFDYLGLPGFPETHRPPPPLHSTNTTTKAPPGLAPSADAQLAAAATTTSNLSSLGKDDDSHHIHTSQLNHRDENRQLATPGQMKNWMREGTYALAMAERLLEEEEGTNEEDAAVFVRVVKHSKPQPVQATTVQRCWSSLIASQSPDARNKTNYCSGGGSDHNNRLEKPKLKQARKRQHARPHSALARVLIREPD